MANYNIAQIVFSGKEQCLASFSNTPDGSITPINIESNAADNKPGDWGDQNPPYQQIILNGESININSNETTGVFDVNEPYYLELDIPKDDNFSMDFALLLIPQPKTSDLDQLNYQFIRYLHVPQGGGGSMDQSRVVLYQEKKDGEFVDDEDHPVKVAIAQPIPENASEVEYPFAPNSLYYQKENEEIKYMWTGDSASQDFDPNQENYGYNDIILSHSWKTSSSESNKAKFQLVFTPRVSGMSCLYLYLIPTKEDNDIQWSIGDKTYYGRHIELTGEAGLEAKLYKMKNLVDFLNGSSAKQIGVWGRSELMLSINGEEVKIGPSNYYELQNFAVTNLGVAAQGPEDRFTIDIQY